MKLTAETIPVYTEITCLDALRHTTPALRSDPEVFLSYVPYDITLLDYASAELLRDPDFLRRLYRLCLKKLAIDGYGSYGFDDRGRIWTYFIRNAPEAVKTLCADPELEYERQDCYLFPDAFHPAVD